MILYFLSGMFFGCGISHYKAMKKVNKLRDELEMIKIAITIHNSNSNKNHGSNNTERSEKGE